MDKEYTKENIVDHIKYLSINSVADKKINSHNWKLRANLSISCTNEMCVCNTCNSIHIIGFSGSLITSPYCPEKYLSQKLNIGNYGEFIEFSAYKCDRCLSESMALLEELGDGIKVYHNPTFLSYPFSSCADKLMNDVMA